MKFTPTTLPDVITVEPRCFGDDRGFFMETFQAHHFIEAGLPANFVQDNHSASRQGVLRGLHYQVDNVQGKLVRAVAGEIFDVAVDLRRSSPTFGQWAATVLSAQNHLMVWVPAGFAHGIYVLSERAEIIYKTTDYYNPQAERSLLWNDPSLAIPWPLVNDRPPLLSPKDARGIPLKDAEVFA
jgi:dTDP-4-dehydrorhamnose 3,5-epimerase